MNNRAEGVRVAHPLFQAGGDGPQPISALQLRLYQISYPLALALNRLWHSRLPRFGAGFIKRQPFLCYGAEFGGLYYAGAIWSNPVARNLPQHEWLELRRLAISSDAPRNTASRLLAVMARLIREERPQIVRLVSYHDTTVHAGTIYRAAGWTSTMLGAGGDWNRPNSRNQNGTPRTRPPAQSAEPKQRWEKVIRGHP